MSLRAVLPSTVKFTAKVQGTESADKGMFLVIHVKSTGKERFESIIWDQRIIY